MSVTDHTRFDPYAVKLHDLDCHGRPVPCRQQPDGDARSETGPAFFEIEERITETRISVVHTDPCLEDSDGIPDGFRQSDRSTNESGVPGQLHA